MKITFDVVRVRATRVWRDDDGRRRQQTREFMQTVNPFNRDDDGNVKTRQQILVEVNAERAAWLKKPWSVDMTDRISKTVEEIRERSRVSVTLDDVNALFLEYDTLVSAFLDTQAELTQAKARVIELANMRPATLRQQVAALEEALRTIRRRTKDPALISQIGVVLRSTLDDGPPGDTHVHNVYNTADDLEYRVGRLDLRSNDVLVVRMGERVRPSMTQIEDMRRMVQHLVPSVKCLILPNGEDLSVLSREEIDRRSQPDGVAS